MCKLFTGRNTCEGKRGGGRDESLEIIIQVRPVLRLQYSSRKFSARLLENTEVKYI